jgi:hypothetical protein
MQRSKKTKEDGLRSEWRSVLKKDLTGPTLLEMSGYRVNQDLELLKRTEITEFQSESKARMPKGSL